MDTAVPPAVSCRTAKACSKVCSGITAGSTAISYAGRPPVRFKPVAVTPEPVIASHGGPYAVAIHAPDPAGNPVGDGTIDVQGGLPAPAMRF